MSKEKDGKSLRAERLILLSGLWVTPLWALLVWLRPNPLALTLVTLFLMAAAPLPALLWSRRRARGLAARRDEALDGAEQARQLCETMRFRVARLTQDLTDADRQARAAHQLTLLGQFVAGFLHEVNNPLGILTGRVEVLLEERKTDEPLRRDLEEILKEARYIAKIAETLLPALRQAKADNAFEPAHLDEAAGAAVASLAPGASARGVDLVHEPSEAPRVNVPAHVIEEIVRVLVSNALQAMAGRPQGKIWVRCHPGNSSSAAVLFEVEDDGPGVPDELRPHLFEPFVSRSTGRQRSGLGLFIVASLLKVYEGSIRYEPGGQGGARFVVEVPRARFTKEQPYHWFVSDDPFRKEAP